MNLASYSKVSVRGRRNFKVIDLLPPHRRLPFVHTAVSFLLQDEEDEVNVGYISLSDYLLKGGGRVPHLDQGSLDYLLKVGGRVPHPDQRDQE